MRRAPALRALVRLSGVTVAVVGVVQIAMSQMPSLPAHPSAEVTPAELLSRPSDAAAPNAAQVARGRYLVAAGDCMSCHLRPGGEPFAGGLGLNTPFGVIYTSNITPDPKTGIGAWTSDQFYRAMHEGKDDEGENLYPAFPYPWFRLASRADDDAIFAYLKTVPAVNYTAPENQLPFPLSMRSLISGWNLLFFEKHDFQNQPQQTPEWNRGAYLVNGLGHCGGCHTPKNSLGGDRANHEFYGGKLDNWVAPDLTGNSRTGLGNWNVEDIAEYLATGRNARAGAGGAMADVITYSTSLMNDADRHAIATYLKSLPASPGGTIQPPDQATMRRGAEVYSDACTSCHLEGGVGQSRVFPPLGHDALLQQDDPTGLLHILLGGARVGTSASRPSPLTMPSFAWKLSDQEIADVSTFIRNSWGNQAGAVSAGEVGDLRKKLGLETVHLTDNSGDQN
jgi:mono/diheme cytochrome c family protein